MSLISEKKRKRTAVRQRLVKPPTLPNNYGLLEAETMDAVEKWNTLFVITEVVVGLLGITFNGVVIFTIWKNIHRRISPPTYFILSIAVSDLFSCVIPIPLSIARHFRKEWPFGMTGCRAHAFLIFLLALVSITHLIAISAGKYLTITRSISRDSYFNRKNVVVIILASWIYSLSFSVAPLLGWSRYGLEGTDVTCSVKWESGDQAFFGVVIFACYFLPLAVITFCYYKIHQVSKHIVVNTTYMGGLAMTAAQALFRKHNKTAFYFLAIIAGVVLPWSPYAVVSFLLVLGRKVSPVAVSGCSVFAKISFFINPILYAIFHGKFRRRFVLSVPITKPNRVVRPAVLPSISRTLAL